jgi:quercetin dioxygenase-like cupin family protein
MAELKSTLKVFNEAEVEGKEGHVKGHINKILAGNEEHPSERLRISLNVFEPGTSVPLHWHLIEGLYYAISGRAVLTDIEGKTYDIGPGSVMYISPGIACAHSWHIKERLQLIAMRAETSPQKNIQFEVDPKTKTSSVKFGYLTKQGGAAFKSFY